jgi:hypothetical protein
MPTLSPAERLAGRCGHAACAEVARLLARDGHALVEGILEPGALAPFAARLDADAASMVRTLQGPDARTDPLGGLGTGHLALGLPRVGEWMPACLVANPLVEQLAAHCLGEDAYMAWVGGNTNLPGSREQTVHSDAAWAAPDAAQAAALGLGPWPDLPCSQLIFQFGARAIGAEDGPTEIWPGSHRDHRWAALPLMQFSAEAAKDAAPGFDAEALIEDRRRAMAGGRPLRMEIPEGAAVLRDLRMWHRGMANRSRRPRHMLGVIYTAGYMHPVTGTHPGRRSDKLANFNAEHCVFAASCRSALAPPAPGVGPRRAMLFVDGEVDYYGNTAGDTRRFPDHDGAADHKGTFEEASPRARFWLPTRTEHTAVAGLIASWGGGGGQPSRAAL